jgi:hypothetical protein
MSFLDVMFCGFGSVILLVMLMHGETVRQREPVRADLRAQVERLERALGEGERRVAGLDRALEETSAALAAARSRGAGVDAALASTAAAAEAARDQERGQRARVARLKAELAGLEAETARLDAEVRAARAAGDAARRFTGDGDRQYLTGLKMGGQRILVLLDASASMLDETLVNVLRRRNMSDARRRAAPKWRRAMATVEWLLSRLPPGSRVQVYAFAAEARALLAGSDGRWVPVDDGASLDGVVAAMHALVPGGGTSLHAAFGVLAALRPAPDNVMLITDGLPTRGKAAPVVATVSAEERLAHFRSATASLPPGIPVNTILLPMEGDPLAAAAFWRLAGATRGAFVTPSADWP